MQIKIKAKFQSESGGSVSKQKDPTWSPTWFSKSEPTFSSMSCSEHKTAEMQTLLREVIYWPGLCKWPRADPFLGTGFEKKHKFPKDNQVCLWYSVLISQDQSQKTALAPTLQPLTQTPSRMYVSRRAGPRHHYEIVLAFGFCCHLCFFIQTLLFSLPRAAFLILRFFQSTVLRVISCAIGVEPCSSRMGQLHDVLFLPPTMIFNIWVK